MVLSKISPSIYLLLLQLIFLFFGSYQSFKQSHSLPIALSLPLFARLSLLLLLKWVIVFLLLLIFQLFFLIFFYCHHSLKHSHFVSQLPSPRHIWPANCCNLIIPQNLRLKAPDKSLVFTSCISKSKNLENSSRPSPAIHHCQVLIEPMLYGAIPKVRSPGAPRHFLGLLPPFVIVNCWRF